METEQSVKPKGIRSSLVFNCSLKNGFSSSLSKFRNEQDHDWSLFQSFSFFKFFKSKARS